MNHNQIAQQVLEQIVRLGYAYEETVRQCIAMKYRQSNLTMTKADEDAVYQLVYNAYQELNR